MSAFSQEKHFLSYSVNTNRAVCRIHMVHMCIITCTIRQVTWDAQVFKGRQKVLVFLDLCLPG